jgi:Na+/melibiose symporter-like transporter
MYLSSPILFTALTHWPRLRRFCFPLGLALSVLGFLSSSFTKEIWHLILLQGIIVGLGSNLLLVATTLDLDEWWVRRKGMAYGIMLSAKGLVGTGLPFVFNILLEKFGYRTLIRGWAVAIVRVRSLLIHHSC